MSRQGGNDRYYRAQKSHKYRNVGTEEDDETNGTREHDVEMEEIRGSCGLFFGMFLTPVGRKVQNIAYLAVMIAAVATSIPEVDSAAAFHIYFSSDSSASDEGNFQIEWLTTAIAALGVLIYAHNAVDFRGKYEFGVKSGFCYTRWVDFGFTSSGLLIQIYIMECYLDLGGLLAFLIIVLSLAIQMGTQEHSNAFYRKYKNFTDIQQPIASDDAVDEAASARRNYYFHSWVPLIGTIGLVFSQGIYYGIKGTGSMPTLFKVYIGLSLGFIVVYSLLSAAHNFRMGVFKSHDVYEGSSLFLLFAWKVIGFILVFWIMHQYNNLSYCGATPLNTIV